MTSTRLLRPAHIVVAQDLIWLVDETQPVALVLDGPQDSVGRLVDWCAVPVGRGEGSARDILTDGREIVVSQSDGDAIAWVSADGAIDGQSAPVLSRHCVHDGVVWMARQEHIEPGDLANDGSGPVMPPLGDGLLVSLDRRGNRPDISVDRPVRGVAADGRGLVITVSELPESVGWGGGWSFRYPTRTVVIDWATVGLWGLTGALVLTASLPAIKWVRRWPAPGYYRAGDEDFFDDFGFDAFGLLWAPQQVAGTHWDADSVVTGHDPDSWQERIRGPVGSGFPRNLTVVGDEIWLTLTRQDGHVDAVDVVVVAVHRSGSVRRITAADGVDISAHRRPIERPDEGLVNSTTSVYAEIGNYLREDLTGTGGRVASMDGVSDVEVDLIGQWPDTYLQLMLRHEYYPDVVLRRRIRLFDEFGLPASNDGATEDLEEDLLAGGVPPAAWARNGILDF